MTSSLILTNADANFAQTTNFGRRMWLSPNRNGLIGEFLFGRDAATTAMNSGSGPAPAVVGAPVFGVDGQFGCGFSRPAYVDSKTSPQNEMTLLVTTRNLAMADGTSGGIMLFANYDTTNGGTNTSLIWASNGTVSFQSPNTDATIGVYNAVALAAGVTSWTTFAARVTAGADYQVKIDRFAGGVHIGGGSQAFAGKTRAFTDARTLVLGSARGAPSDTAFNATADFLLAELRSVALSDADLLAVHQAHVRTMASRGVTI